MYCSKACQVTAWKTHKAVCKRLLEDFGGEQPDQRDFRKHFDRWNLHHRVTLLRGWSWAIDLNADITAWEKKALRVRLEFQPHSTNAATKFKAVAAFTSTTADLNPKLWAGAGELYSMRSDKTGPGLIIFTFTDGTAPVSLPVFIRRDQGPTEPTPAGWERIVINRLNGLE